MTDDDELIFVSISNICVSVCYIHVTVGTEVSEARMIIKQDC